jgi:hypothetical protein
MIKFKDSEGNVIGQLDDDSNEPIFDGDFEDAKKRKRSKKNKRINAEMGDTQKTLIMQQDPTYVASGKSSTDK